MEKLRFSHAPLSLKLLATMIVLGTGITYLVLLSHIYIDTEFRVPLIKQAYSDMDWIELVDQTHKYFPYYGIYIFAFTIIMFVLGTSYSEQIKRLVALVPPCLIVTDIASMWGIAFVNADIFSWMLFFAGTFLALSFFAIAASILYDIWLRDKVKL